jgi:hypothetical protein
MRAISKRLPSPPMIVACLALFIALSAGAAADLPGIGVVNSGDIKNNTIRGKDIRNGTVRGNDVKDDSLTGADVLESGLGTVPNASHADSAGRATSADTANRASSAGSAKTADTATNAGHATSADTATNAGHATNADTVGGRSAASLDTSHAFNQQSSFVASLGTSFVNQVSATITTTRTGGVVAQGSAELIGADADEVGECRIAIEGVFSLPYRTTFDDIGTSNHATVPVTFGRTLPAGQHTATLQCRGVTGTVGSGDSGISLVGVG